MHAVRDVSSYFTFAYSDEEVVSVNPNNNNGSKSIVRS